MKKQLNVTMFSDRFTLEFDELTDEIEFDETGYPDKETYSTMKEWIQTCQHCKIEYKSPTTILINGTESSLYRILHAITKDNPVLIEYAFE